MGKRSAISAAIVLGALGADFNLNKNVYVMIEGSYADYGKLFGINLQRRHVAAGVGVRFYTHSCFRADLSALYHLSLPLDTFNGGSASDANETVQDPAGEAMKPGLSGFELRLGVAILIPDSWEAGK